MTPGHDWDRITELLDLASSIPPQDRLLWLDANEPRPDLRDKVRRLLTTWEQDPHFLEINQQPLTQAGPWLIRGEIARGGMGRVFEAVHQDPSIARRVALKVIGTDRFSPTLLESFLQERAILARLEHPSIARLYDTGTTPLGLPYFAMEFIEGLPLNDWLAQNNPTPRLRVQLLLAISEAIAYAHQNFIAHGDLKPSNILITPRGEPRILDFGIGRLLNTNNAGLLPMLTPGHASPEQISGQPITASSDIYQLGLLLRDSVPKPSHELAAIIARCLRNLPAERYPNVEAFSADLRAWLDSRPLTVLPNTFLYRLSKTIRRSPFAAALVLALIAGVIGTSWQAWRAERQRLENLKQFEETRQFTRKLLESVVEVPVEAQSSIVNNALRMLEGLTTSNKNNPQLAIEMAFAYGSLASVQGVPGNKNLGDLPAALSSLEKGVGLAAGAVHALPEQALGTQAILIGRAIMIEQVQHNPTRKLLWLAKLEETVKALERYPATRTLGNSYIYLGIAQSESNAPLAAQFYEKAIDAYARAGLEKSSNNALALKRLGAVLLMQKRLDEGTRRYEQALAIERSISAPPLSLSYTISDIGYSYRERKMYPQAIAKFREALAIRQAVYDKDPRDENAKSSLASIQERLAFTLALDGQFEEAISRHRIALQMFQTRARAIPSSVEAKKEVASVLAALAVALEGQNSSTHAPEIRALRQQALQIYRQYPSESFAKTLKFNNLDVSAR